MILEAFHLLSEEERKSILWPCCGSTTWVNKMMKLPTVSTLSDVLDFAGKQWYNCSEKDWKEAFSHHPKIGDVDALKEKFAADQFAGKEQSGINEAPREVLEQLASGNQEYEKKFGYLFIIFATGKTADEMLQLLQSRLDNKPEEEIKIAMEEQHKIMKLRLMKLFSI
jgi:2-oxo-4-hydroxy-4-carboxy-5-ureidoimidazoline decarboxylase